MKNSKKTALGIVLVAVAALLLVGSILEKVGVIPDPGISAWKIIFGAAFLFALICALIRKKISHIFIPLAALFLLFERNIAGWCGIESGNLLSNWIVIVSAILLTIGVGILDRSMRRKKNLQTDCKRNVNRMGAKTVYVDCKDFKEELFENRFGACDIFFANAEAYVGGGTLVIDNSLGAMNIHVPKEWKIKCNVENHLGTLNVDDETETEEPTAEEKILYVKGRNDNGAVAVVRD